MILSRGLKKRCLKNADFFSKFRHFRDSSGTIKTHPNLLKKPAFIETFLKNDLR